VRVVLAEDSLTLREELVRLLEEAGAQVVAAVGDAEELLAAAIVHRPGLVVVDVELPPSFTDEGLRAVREVRAAVPAGVLLLARRASPAHAADLLAGGGGAGYLLIRGLAGLTAALERIVAGGVAIDPRVVETVLTHRRARERVAALPASGREVLALVAAGHSDAEIARRTSAGVGQVLARLGIAASEAPHRRVGGVLTWSGW
jgi:DNA-binding NarL/FixJ family response regulator